MSQSYDELSGGLGHSINYRAERFPPRALFHHSRTALEIDGRPVELGDVSATGLCYLADVHSPAPPVGELVDFRLVLSGRDAAHGRGAVVRVQPEAGAARIGVRFVDRLVAPDSLRALDADTAFEASVARGTSVYSEVPGDYRAACFEAQLMLSHWQHVLDERERDIRVRPDAASRLVDVESASVEAMRREWLVVRERAGTASDRIGDGHPGYAASRRLTDVLLAPFVARSPFLGRCRIKPRGYPGDFLAMSWMYEGQRRGDSLFGRVLDQLGLEERLAHTVPMRRDALLEHLMWRARRPRADGRPTRILNLGAGPARELHEWLDRLEPGPRFELVLIDQDEQALAFAHERVTRAALRHAGRVRVVCRHLSFRQLFAEPRQLQELGGCGLIYSAGLFDYLRTSTAKTLIEQCFELLEPGGRLLVGNAADAPIVRWVPEYALDWKMIYRTADDMHALGAPFADRARIEQGMDSSGAWHLLTLTRPD